MSHPLSSLIDQLLACHGPRALQERLRSPGPLLFEQLWETPKAVIGTLLTRTCRTSGLWIIGQTQESRLSDDLLTFGVKVLELPSWETMPHEQVPPSPDLVGQRMQTLHQLLQAKHSCEPLLVLAPLQSALQRVLPPQELARLTLQLRAGEEIPYERMITGLEEAGYRRVAVVSDKGEYAQRGALIDLFPISTPDPYRIEFLGDEIADIRLFDIASQKSRGQATQLLILPARELELLQECESPGTIWDYLPKQSALLLDDLLAIEEHYVALKGLPGAFSRSFQTFDEWFAGRDETSRLLLFADRPLDQLSDVRLESAPEGKVVHFDWLGRGFTAFPQPAPFRSVSDSFHPDELSELPAPLALLDSVSAAQRELALSVAYLCTQEQDERQLRSWIDDLQIPFTDSSQILRGYLSGGLVSMEDHLAIIPTPEFTHRYKLRRQRQRSSYHAPELDIQELRPGDVVVHFHHGVGRFVGMETKTNHLGEPAEFLVLEFAERSRLYVPAHQAHLVTRYMGMEESTPAFHTLGASRWKKQREQTEKAIAGYAQQLLQLHAARQVHGGIAFPQDSSDLQLFEQNFPFDPTEDQQLAIDAVKQDMMRPQSMDRLICGDVGYGKTEVAMRAAYKAVVDGGKQVAVLVPTTVLALQHYESFVERMEGSPVRVGCLSRLLKPKQQRELLAQLASGAIDIVIGTHRLVSKDVHFKDLGLLVIDEEQRFGVKAKETLRSLRVGVDTLTLSATPIPRTLHFAMMGARDLSIIATPPQDRLPIKTILCEEDEHVVQSALLREFSRQGQVYYIHNRVETIYGVAGRLQKLVPQARIAIAHGQMDPDALDEVFHRFKSGEANLLLATSIVENGLDIPNANTLIVERADLFGLAELYQLRGRVGRWNRTAYAYLLVPRHRRLAETTQQRLEALLVNRGHGGGFRVAMRDLEIRGAGDLLGTEQSGHICTVGYHLYTKLLKKTMSALQGAAIAPTSECKVELPVDARLPVEYVPESGLRMEFYQRLGEASSEEEIQQLQHELRDRFGPLPTQASWLVAIASIRLAASKRGIVALTWERGSLQLQVPSGAPPGITHSSRRCGLYQQDPERSLREIHQQLIAWATETPPKTGQKALDLAKKALGK